MFFERLEAGVRAVTNFCAVILGMTALATFEVKADMSTLKQELTDGVLGLRWGVDAQVITERFPQARKVGSERDTAFGVNVPAGLWDVHPLNDHFLLKMNEQGRLDEVYFSTSDSEVRPLVERLTRELGAPRHTAAKDVKTFVQVYEWSTAQYGVRVRYSTLAVSPETPSRGGPVNVTSGPLTDSLIDRYEKAKSGTVNQ